MSPLRIRTLSYPPLLSHLIIYQKKQDWLVLFPSLYEGMHIIVSSYALHNTNLASRDGSKTERLCCLQYQMLLWAISCLTIRKKSDCSSEGDFDPVELVFQWNSGRGRTGRLSVQCLVPLSGSVWISALYVAANEGGNHPLIPESIIRVWKAFLYIGFLLHEPRKRTDTSLVDGSSAGWGLADGLDKECKGVMGSLPVESSIDTVCPQATIVRIIYYVGYMLTCWCYEG